MRICLFFLSTFVVFSFFGAALAAPQPSSLDCHFYLEIESEMRCGPQAYFQKWALPMCEKYVQYETDPFKKWLVTSELRAWFPKVRLCLQQYLAAAGSNLSCHNLPEHANQSHVQCYVQTGYCEMSGLSKAQLASLSAKAVIIDPDLWEQSAWEIAEICVGKITSGNRLGSGFVSVPSRE